MAICKHNTSKNGFAAPLEYLTLQHDASGRLLLDGEGIPIPRDTYIINGINCLPETFAPLCLQDRIRFGKKAGKHNVDTHQYIISFAPRDIQRGLTMEKAHAFALAFARKNFPGHRVLVCTHPDGENHAGNIHVHIIVSNLRFQDRKPDPQFMKSAPDGTVRLSDYRAGCSHQDTPALRKHLLSQINNYCYSQGYVMCPEKAGTKVSQKEYLLKQRGIDTRNDQLRRAIADAATTTNSWDAFVEKLGNAYSHSVPVIPPIPYADRQKLWKRYKELNGHFWVWDKQLRPSLQAQLKEAFQELKLCKQAEQKDTVRYRINRLKQEQAAERLFRQTWQTYARAASLALRSQNHGDALLCLEQLEELAKQQSGCWQEGWNRSSDTHSLLDGSVKSKLSWKQISNSDLEIAQKILDAVAEEAQYRKSLSSQTQEVPMPIEVKLTRGTVSFRHPDSERWVRGSRLGEAFTLQELGIRPPCARTQTPQQKRYALEHSR